MCKQISEMFDIIAENIIFKLVFQFRIFICFIYETNTTKIYNFKDLYVL